MDKNKFVVFFEKIFIKKIEKIEIYFGATAFSLLVIILFVNCITRYVFRSPLVWAEELAVYLFIWTIFVGASLAFKNGKHLKITVGPEEFFLFGVKFSNKILVNIILMVLFFFLIVQGVKAFNVQRTIHTFSFPINFPNSYVYALPLIVSSFSMLFVVIGDIIRYLFKLQ